MSDTDTVAGAVLLLVPTASYGSSPHNSCCQVVAILVVLDLHWCVVFHLQLYLAGVATEMRHDAEWVGVVWGGNPT